VSVRGKKNAGKQQTSNTSNILGVFGIVLLRGRWGTDCDNEKKECIVGLVVETKGHVWCKEPIWEKQ